MRILIGHAYLEQGMFQRQWFESWLSRLRAASIDIYPIQIGLNIRERRFPWKELDQHWRRGDKVLLDLYERVAREAEHYDVFINHGGINLHPEFLQQLPTVNALQTFDELAAVEKFAPYHVAVAYDLCMVGNASEVEIYKSWGLKNVQWGPAGFWAEDFDPALSYEDILTKHRDVDITLLCERVNHWRRKKVDQFALAFPQGVYRGFGWPQGFLPEPERVPLLQRTRIGINIHNTTGPSNFRTYYLPANGILQICDQKSHLGKIFELGKEVLGYDTIAEAIDLCRYYLEHEDERREIAAAGWKRAVSDYNEVAAFQHVIQAINELCGSKTKPGRSKDIVITLHQRRRETRARRVAYVLGLPFSWPYRQAPRYVRGAYRRLLRLFDNASLWLKSRLT